MIGIDQVGGLSPEVIEEAVTWRHHLHQHPQLALNERQTAHFIRYVSAVGLTNPKERFEGVSLSAMSEAEANGTSKHISESLGFPCVDPIRVGVESIVVLLDVFDVR